MRTRRLAHTLIVIALALAPFFAIASDLDTAQSYKNQGDHLFEAGKMQEAIAAYNQALWLYEGLAFPMQAAVIRHQLGAAYWRLGELQQALRFFEANLAFHARRGDNESKANYLFYTGQLYLLTGQIERAEPNLAEAAGLFASNPSRLAEVEHWRIRLSEKRGDIDEARAILEAARLKLDDDNWALHLAADALRLGVSASSVRETQTNQRTLFFLAALTLIATVAIALRLGLLGNKTKNVLLVASSTALTVLAVEGALRLLLPTAPSIRHLLHTPNQVTEFFPSAEILVGVDTPQTRFTINSDGLRGDPLPTSSNVPRILAIGASSTEALFLDDKDAWPHVLQRLLTDALSRPVWVGNAGKSGLNSFSHATQFYFYKDELRPDIVILQAGINDLNQCISGGLPAIRDNARFVRETGFFDDYQRFVFQQVRELEPPRWRLAEVFQRAIRSLSAQNGVGASNPPFDYVVQDKAATFYVEQRARRQRAQKVERAPDISECLSAFRYNLELITQMAKGAQIKLLLLTQGSLYRDNLSPQEEALLWFGSLDVNPFASQPADRYYKASVLNQLLTQYNQQTLAVCTTGDAECLDVDGVLPKTIASYYDDVHLNIAGSRALANALADFLLSKNYLQAN